MANQPYLPLYTGDWKKDPKLSMCSPSTRGIWIDLLCSLHDARISQLTAMPEQFARLCRCDTGSMLAGLLELQSTGAANVSEREGSFTVVCRRMKKAEELSQQRALSGSKGGAKSKANREQTPDIESEDNGLERVRGFGKEKGIPEADCDWFYFKGSANGWTNGGRPILDWKMTLLSWQRAKYLPSQKNGNGIQNGNSSRPMGFQERKSLKEKIQNQLNLQYHSAPKDSGGNAIFTDKEKHDRDILRSKLVVL